METTENSSWVSAVSNVKTDLDLVPAGSYNVELSGVKTRDAEGEYDASVTFEFTVKDGECDGRKIWHRCKVAADENKLKNLFKTLKGLELTEVEEAVKTTPSLVAALDVIAAKVEPLLGVLAKVSVRHSHWQGKDYVLVNSVTVLSEADVPF